MKMHPGFAERHGVVAEGRTPHAVRLLFSTDANHEGMLSRLMGGMEDHNRPGAAGDNPPIGKANPLPLVLRQKLVADSPIARLVLMPIWVDLSSDLRRQSVGQAFHG
jgi:hypothetical protein